MRLCIIGTGYVGLVAAACFAEMGNSVRCVDINPEVVEQLNRGEIHIYEPGLQTLVSRNCAEGRLTFTSVLSEGLENSECAFICVGTPPREDGSCDLSYVDAVAVQIAENMQQPLIIVNKSTVPVGTADRVYGLVRATLDKHQQDVAFDVVSNPEFLKEGDAVADFMKPDRIIIGTNNQESAERMRELYAPFARSREKVLVMNPRSAEMSKYAANCMLATKISFINEMAGICEQLGADIRDVRTGIGADHRIGHHFIYPGIGYGGSCFPKDVKALIHKAHEVGRTPLLLEAVEAVNRQQKVHMAQRVREIFATDGGVQGKTLAMWGLSFKANTDDIRESPALSIIEDLLAYGMRIRAFDPEAGANVATLFANEPNLQIEQDPYALCQDADALLIATEWNQFRNPDFERLKTLLKKPLIFDGRNLYSPTLMQHHGFTYICIGKR